MCWLANLLIEDFYNNYHISWLSNYQIKTMAKKGNRVQVILECTEHKNSGLPGTSRYISEKNKKNNPERLELKKFNPIMKKMTLHKEIK